MASDIEIRLKLQSTHMTNALKKVTRNFEVMNKTIKNLNKEIRGMSKTLVSQQKKLQSTTRNTTHNINKQTQAIKRTQTATERLISAQNRLRHRGSAGARQHVQGQFPGGTIGLGGAAAGIAMMNVSASKGTNVLQKFGNAAQKATPLVKGLGVAAAGMIVQRGLREFGRLAESAQEVQNRIRVTLTPEEIGAGKVPEIFDKLTAAAIETRQPLRDMAIFYSRINLAASKMGVTQNQAMKSTVLFSKLLTIQGATMHEARSALLQFSQSLQAGKLAGDEFRSISEVLPGILRLIARETKQPIERLKSLAEQGDLTPDLMLRAILKAEKTINEQFKKTVVTITQGFNQVNTMLIASTNAFIRTKEGAMMVAGFFKILRTLVQGLTFAFNSLVMVIRIVNSVFTGLGNTFNNISKGLSFIANKLSKLTSKEQTEKLKALNKAMGIGGDRKGVEDSLMGRDLTEDKEKRGPLGALLGDHDPDDPNNITQRIHRSIKKFSKEITINMTDFKNAFQNLIVRTIAIDFAEGVGQSFADMIVDGKNFKESMSALFKDMAKQVIAQITKMIVQMILMRTLMAALGFQFPGISLLGGGKEGAAATAVPGADVLGKLIPKKAISVFGFGKRQHGGPVTGGNPYVVGEAGPELFVPNNSGRIEPNAGRPIVIQSLQMFPNASLDDALLNRPMQYWVDFTQEKILPALNNLGQAGSTTTLKFEEAR
jgi:tape measure domain-containing protein